MTKENKKVSAHYLMLMQIGYIENGGSHPEGRAHRKLLAEHIMHPQNQPLLADLASFGWIEATASPRNPSCGRLRLTDKGKGIYAMYTTPFPAYVFRHGLKWMSSIDLINMLKAFLKELTRRTQASDAFCGFLGKVVHNDIAEWQDLFDTASKAINEGLAVYTWKPENTDDKVEVS